MTVSASLREVFWTKQRAQYYSFVAFGWVMIADQNIGWQCRLQLTTQLVHSQFGTDSGPQVTGWDCFDFHKKLLQ